MMHLGGYVESQDYLSDLLPWAMLVAPGIVLNKDGSFQATIKYRGADFENTLISEQVALTGQINNAFRRLGSGWVLYLEAQRKAISEYPSDKEFKNTASWLVDFERRQSFIADEENFDSEFFLTIQYLPPTQKSSFLRKLSPFGKSAHSNNEEKELAAFQENVHRIFDVFHLTMPEAILLNDAEILSYLHSTISVNSHAIVKPDIPVYLDSILADCPLIGGLQPKLGDHHLKTITILAFPASTSPALLCSLSQLPFSCRWVSRFISLDKSDAEKQIKDYRRKWFAKRKGFQQLITETISRSESAMRDGSSIEQAEDADAALLELTNEYVTYGYLTITVVVTDPDEEKANNKRREIEKVVNGLGFSCVSESFNLLESWLSSLPGQAYANVRRPLVNSLNLAHLAPISGQWSGPHKDPHLKGPIWFLGRSRGQSILRVPVNHGDVGHKLVVGPTGAGKSVLLSFMALQFQRYKNSQVFFFDKGGSALAATAGAGGEYEELGGRNSMRFQPLAKIDVDSEARWALDWLCGLLENEAIEVNAEHKEALWSALQGLADMAVNRRTLSGLKALVQNEEVRLALDVYTQSGVAGYLLDSESEKISDSSWLCFEMQVLMETPRLVGPVLGYVFHRLQDRFDGRPSLLILDEAWVFLDSPIFRKRIKDWLKTLRKLNVSVICAMQSADDMLNSEIAATLIESSPARIFLPNARALEPQIGESYGRLGLNDRQIDIIANALPKSDYYFQSPDGCSLFQSSFGPVTLAFCGMSRPEEKARILELMVSGNAETFCGRYLESLGFSELAKFIRAERSA